MTRPAHQTREYREHRVDGAEGIQRISLVTEITNSGGAISPEDSTKLSQPWSMVGPDTCPLNCIAL